MSAQIYVALRVESPLFLPDFNETWNFLTDFRKIRTSSFMKIHSVGAEIFHTDRRTDGRTDMTKIIAAFRNFANAPKNE